MVQREPVAVAALVAAVAVLLVRAGVDLTQTEQDAITVLVAAVAAWWARRKVTPA